MFLSVVAPVVNRNYNTCLTFFYFLTNNNTGIQDAHTAKICEHMRRKFEYAKSVKLPKNAQRRVLFLADVDQSFNCHQARKIAQNAEFFSVSEKVEPLVGAKAVLEK